MHGPGAQRGQPGWEGAFWVRLARRYLRAKRRARRFATWLALWGWRQRSALATAVVEAAGGEEEEEEA